MLQSGAGIVEMIQHKAAIISTDTVLFNIKQESESECLFLKHNIGN